MAEEELPPTDHNNPPAWADAEDLLEAFARAPEILPDEVTAQKAVILSKQIAQEEIALIDQRIAEAEPYVEAAERVRGPYTSTLVRLDRAKTALKERLTKYGIQHNLDKIETEVSLGAGCVKAYRKTLPRYRVTDIEAVPAPYLDFNVDHNQVMQALRRGETIPGIERLPDQVQFIVK